MTQRKFTIYLKESDIGQRLDKVLATHVPDVSRELWQAAIKEGKILTAVGDVLSRKPSAKIEELNVLEAELAMPEQPKVEPIPLQDFFGQALDILFEDEHLLILNKPAGLTVHPGAGTSDPTLVHALLHHCQNNLSNPSDAPLRPGIIHRLDKETSGVMVVAKTDTIHKPLAKLFEERDITRSYVALCYGSPFPVIGEIEVPIGRHPQARTKMAVVKEEEGGKYALTHYHVLEAFDDQASLIQCRLATGRTHQIRVHLSYRKSPVIGDTVYARQHALKGATAELADLLSQTKRQMLHAQELGFTHPITGEDLHFKAAPPADFQTLKTALQACYGDK